MKQKPSKNFYDLLFVIQDLGSTALKKIKDYESKVHANPLIKKDFYNIDFVYMHSILLDLAKLISVTRSDQSGLRQLKDISPQDIKDRIEKFEEKYKNIIQKITNNRNRIISHVDISDAKSYFKMGFSKLEIDRKIDDYEQYLKHIGVPAEKDLKIIEDLKKLQSNSIEEERYSPSDFFDDIEDFKEMINEILVISSDLNFYYYNINTVE